MQCKLLQFSDLGYWFAGEQEGTEQVEDREVNFKTIKIKSHQLLSSASFEKHAAGPEVLMSFLGRPQGMKGAREGVLCFAGNCMAAGLQQAFD